MIYMSKKYKRVENDIDWNNDFVRMICGLVDFIYDLGKALEKSSKKRKKK